MKKCPDPWHHTSSVESRPISPAEMGLSQIISFLLEKYSGGTLTISSEEWDAYMASHINGLLKTEVDGEKQTMTLTSMIGEDAASTRFLLEMPDGPKH